MELQPVKESVWTTQLLTQDECRRLIDAAEVEGISNPESAVEKAGSPDKRHRDCLRVEIDNDHLSAAVWERIQYLVPQEVWVGEGHPPVAGVEQTEEMYGRWVPCGVNSHWRVVCYPGRGHFSPHRDSDYTVNENERSLLTINGYLTALPKGYGGATRFLEDDQPLTTDEKGRFIPVEGSVTHRVEADAAGKAVIFFHRLMHDGEPLEEGCPPKWLFRTEVMYKRDPSTAPKLSTDQKEARKLVKEAEEAENGGNVPEAMKLYKRAYRLDPTLDGN